MKLIVGLGNPGKEYEKTRHNTGFMAIDALANDLGVSINQVKFKGLYTKTKIKGEDVVLLKPTTFMNNSGESVQEVMRFFKIGVEDILVIYDDLDLETGRLRIRENGSAGGHNGIKSIIAHVGGQNFKRIRIGIQKNPLIPVVDYVLGKFSQDEMEKMQQGLNKAVVVCKEFIDTDFHKIMSIYNAK